MSIILFQYNFNYEIGGIGELRVSCLCGSGFRSKLRTRAQSRVNREEHWTLQEEKRI